MTQLNRSLSEAIAAQTKYEQLGRRLKAVEADLGQMRGEVAKLEIDLEREEQDVRRLKESGLLGLWFDLIGKRVERLAKEEEEAALARLQHAEAVRRLQELEGERSELTASRIALGNPTRTVEELLIQKRALIRQQHPTAADRLLAFDEEEVRLESLEVELSEAKRAGDRAVQALSRMEESLEGARRLGVWDAWTNGGILVDLAKHDRLDEAQTFSMTVQHTLTEFQRELRDVDAALHAPTIEIDSWDRGFDIWFDNLWTDWSILNRIDDALDRVRSTGNRLERLLEKLTGRLAKVSADLQRVKAEREQFLTNFGQA